MKRLLGASLLSILIGACATPAASTAPSEGPSPSPSPFVPSPSPTSLPTTLPSPAPSPTPAASAMALWPTDAVAPAPNADGAVWLQHIRWGDTGGAYEMLAVLADGWVVRARFDDPGPRLVLRQLTATGLQRIRDQVAAVGLFDQSQSRKLTKPLDCCGAGDQVRVTTTGGTVSVGRMLAPSDFYVPSAAWDRFDALVDAMVEPDSWVPSTGWAGTGWQPYHAASYCVTVSLEGATQPASLDGLAIDWAGILPFGSFGKPAYEESTTDRAGVVDAGTIYRLVNGIGKAANADRVPPAGAYDITFDAGGAQLGLGGITAPGIEGPISLLIEANPPGFTRCP